MNNNCYIYLRVSTEEQAKEGFSLENQRRACLEYAKTNSYQVSEIFLEDGKSARTTDRPEFQKLLKAIKDKPPKAIIVYKIDRFARNVADFSNLRKEFRKQGVKLLSLVEGGDVTDGLVGNIFASVAEWESEVNGKRTKDAMSQKFREGWWPGWAPLGYKNVERKGKRIVVPDPKLAPKMKEAAELYATGNYSYLELCEEMYEKGLVTKTGKKISISAMQQHISNPFYYGLMRWGGMEKMGKHKPIISKALFDQCQYVAAKHRSFAIRQGKYDFLLRSLVRCQDHERRLVAEWHYDINSKQRTKIGYYHCCQRGGCKGSYVEIDKMEQMVANLFKKYQFTPEFIELIKEKVREYFDNARGNINSKKQALVNKRMAIEKKRNELEGFLIDGTIDRETFKRQHSNLQEQIGQFENQIDELEAQRQLDVDIIDEVLALSRNIYQTYMEAPKFLKRHYIRFFFERLYVKDKKIAKVIETPIFSTLRKQHLLILRTNWLPGLDLNQQP